MKIKSFFVTLFFVMLTTINSQAQSPMRAMSKLTGLWKAEFIMWMDPAQPPMRDQLTAHREMIMNGLFFTSHYTGQSMGMNYEGLSTSATALKRKST